MLGSDLRAAQLTLPLPLRAETCIAMSLPALGAEAAYRNPLHEVCACVLVCVRARP